MCGLFATTDPGIARFQEAVSFLVGRRGTEPVRWHQGSNGYCYAHSLLPLRGEFPTPQPMVDKRGVFLFTGELWDGDPAESDTARLLELYRSAGMARLASAAVGTWAVVVFDARSGSLRFGTDRFGEQPLHYALVRDHLYIGSEVKFLVAAGVPLSQIKHVAPDSTFVYSRGQLRAQARPPWISTNRFRSFDPRALRQRLSASVADQVRAAGGRRIAVLLSGGIDSTIIAHEAASSGVREAWTVAVHESAPDVQAARTVAERLGLNWKLVITEPLEPEIGIVTGETSNRSIVEELSVQVRLLQALARSGIHIVLTGTGADEVFVGYTHLFGRIHPTEMQQRFVTTHYRFDLRAFNKAAVGFTVEPRNPFLHRDVVSYARQLHADILIGPNREMKWPLRLAYADVLGHSRKPGKLVARETMGAKSWFANRLPESPLIFRRRFSEILSSPLQTRNWIARAAAAPLVSSKS